MSREPFMPLAVSDFLGSSACAEMTGEQQAIYLLLLAHAWNQKEKGLPARMDAIAKLTHLNLRKSRRDIALVLTQFEQVSGRYYNLRVNRDLERIRTRSEVAKRCAEKRWSKNREEKETEQKQCEGIAKAMHPSGYGYGSSSSSSSLEGGMQGGISAEPSHPDSVDVESEARRLLELWREIVNSSEPQSSGMPVLRNRLTDGWSPAQLRLVVERKAAEVRAEAATSIRYKLRNFFRDPSGEWTELLSDSWTEPAPRDGEPISDGRMRPKNVQAIKGFLKRHENDPT